MHMEGDACMMQACESEFLSLSAGSAGGAAKPTTNRRKKRWPLRGCHEGAASLLALAEMGRCGIRVSSSSQ